jgi:hypothetical protein
MSPELANDNLRNKVLLAAGSVLALGMVDILTLTPSVGAAPADTEPVELNCATEGFSQQFGDANQAQVAQEACGVPTPTTSH